MDGLCGWDKKNLFHRIFIAMKQIFYFLAMPGLVIDA